MNSVSNYMLHSFTILTVITKDPQCNFVKFMSHFNCHGHWANLFLMLHLACDETKIDNLTFYNHFHHHNIP